MKHFKTISEFHEFIKLPKPQHPLISVLDISTVPHWNDEEPLTMLLDFYAISVKRMHNVHSKYGQHSFDFNEGIRLWHLARCLRCQWPTKMNQ
jgi:AraC family transcriptional regulator of arabinose operon